MLPLEDFAEQSRTSRYTVKGRIILQLKSPQANALWLALERNTTSNYRTRHSSGDARQRGHVLSRVGWTSRRRDTREKRLRYSKAPMYFPFRQLIAPLRAHARGVRYIGFCEPRGCARARGSASKDCVFIEIDSASFEVGTESYRCSSVVALFRRWCLLRSLTDSG